AVYTLASMGYTSGLSVTYRVTDGPLQPGAYRLTLTTGLTDKSGNPLAAPYLRTFTAVGVSPFTLENRANDSTATATPLGTVTSAFSGSSPATAGPSTGSNPHAVIAAYLNGDSHLDVVTANNGAGTVSVFLGNGDGTFAPKVDYTVGSGPIALA